MDLSEVGSTASSRSESESDASFDDDEFSYSHSFTSMISSHRGSASNLVEKVNSAAENEFKVEVAQSLERAFFEEHSVDNAAVELKTLRMASNVPLRSVRQAIVAYIVERIELVESGATQRQEISRVIGRWGELINKIGGVNAVETIELLQVGDIYTIVVVQYNELIALQAHCVTSTRLPLFGQILAALYQGDIVEEDDIRKWHSLPSAKGEGLESSVQERYHRCWAVGTRIIQQFDDQEDAGGESSENDEG